MQHHIASVMQQCFEELLRTGLQNLAILRLKTYTVKLRTLGATTSLGHLYSHVTKASASRVSQVIEPNSCVLESLGLTGQRSRPCIEVGDFPLPLLERLTLLSVGVKASKDCNGCRFPRLKILHVRDSCSPNWVLRGSPNVVSLKIALDLPSELQAFAEHISGLDQLVALEIDWTAYSGLHHEMLNPILDALPDHLQDLRLANLPYQTALMIDARLAAGTWLTKLQCLQLMTIPRAGIDGGKQTWELRRGQDGKRRLSLERET